MSNIGGDTKTIKYSEKIKPFLRDNALIFILIFTTWLKLIWLDSIMFDDPKGLSVIFFVAMTLSSSIMLFVGCLLFKKARFFLASALATFTSLWLWADIIYFRYFGSLIKVGALQIATQTTGVGDSVANLVSWWDILLFIDLIIIIFYRFIRKRKSETFTDLGDRVRSVVLIIAITFIPITAIFVRDWNYHLKGFIYRNYDMNLIEFRYGAFVAHGINAYRSLLTAMEHLDQEERASAIEWVGTHATGQQDNHFTALAKGKNIYLIQIESLQDFVIGRSFEDREITPNLNRLIDQSYYFENGRTAVGGGGTADSDFSANTSLYPLQESSAVVQYGADDFTGLPKALRGDGYSVNAYHGYRRDFWNRGTAFSSFGFEHFFAGEEYQINEKIIMGLSDESFYRQTLDKLSNEGSPTFNFVVSLSSHHPFIMAEKYQTLGGDVSKYDFKTFHYLQAVHYADYALGIFLDGLKERGLYEDSLVIVYGDHPAKIGDLNDPNVQKMINGFEMKEMDKIPFIYKLPVQKNGYKIPRETNQLDIMPTILNLTGTKTNFPMFGGDVLEGTKRNITREEAIHYSELLIRFNLFEDFSR